MDDVATAIWNRACATRPVEAELRPGDNALAAMVSFHGLVMNRGALDAVQQAGGTELEAAVAAYGYFGVDKAGALLSELSERGDGLSSDALDRLEAEADRRYAEVVPSDEILTTAFEARLIASPEAFAPME